jgi:hypothetical protein
MAKNKAGVFFIFSPVLGLIEAFNDLKSRNSRTVIFLFCLIFGLCFSVGTIRTEGSADGISMRAEFEETKDMTTAQYVTYLKDYFEFDTGAQDIYIVTVSYLVGRVTDNYHFFFFVLAFIFAFFQLKCFKYFVSEKNFTNSAICIILACLFLWNNIYNINGARFWTASWIGLYCVFKVFYDKKTLYLFLSLITPMIHASFAIFPFVMLIALLTQKLDNAWLFLFIASWAFSVMAEDFKLNPFGNIDLPFLVGKKVEAYTDREFIENLSQGTGFYWVQMFFRSLSRHYIDLLILLIALNKKRLYNKQASSVVGMMVVLATFANFGMIIPTFGGRFFYLNYALVAYSFLVSFGDKKYRAFVYILPFVWFMNLYYLARDIIMVLDLGFLLSPIISFVRFAMI